MDSGLRESGSGDDNEQEISTSRSGKAKKNYHRHSSQQIQHLEAFFKDCPHPDENQRRQLSNELGLEPKQIKFWFQNKRTQAKTQHEKADNSALRTENERIHCENLAMREALNNVVCTNCDGPVLGEEDRQRALQLLKMENAQLREEYERISAFINTMMPMGRSAMMAPPLTGPQPETNNFAPTSAAIAAAAGSQIPVDHPPEITIHPNIIPNDTTNINNNQLPPFTLGGGLKDVERGVIIEIVSAAMEEVVELLRADDRLWIPTAVSGGVTETGERLLVLRRENYDKVFPKANFLGSISAREESSKDSGVVSASAVELIEMCLDPNKWMDFFPTTVTKARIIEVLDSGVLGGSLQLMYQRMHILSPMVAPRDFIFVRYCQRVEESSWLMVDVSYDCFKDVENRTPSYSWKLPSGCLIQDLGNGKSQVTWVEHVQVDDRAHTHRLYNNLIIENQAYGARRWIAALQRMCQRHELSLGLRTAPADRHELEQVITVPQGKRSLMQLSQRMVKSFFKTFSNGETIDFPQMNEMSSSGVRVAVRRSTEQGTPEGVVICAATSVWLSLPKEFVFEFFRDNRLRSRWDVLSQDNPVTEIARAPIGSHPRNCISIIQPFVQKEGNMVILQESCIDSVEAYVVYAPIDLPAISSTLNGDDPIKVPVLPSGFVISGDGQLPLGMTTMMTSAAGPSSSRMGQSGSLLTLALQILMSTDSLSKQINMEFVVNVHSLVSSTIQKIKAALLDCNGFD